MDRIEIEERVKNFLIDSVKDVFGDGAYVAGEIATTSPVLRTVLFKSPPDISQ